ncbi:MAG: DUF1289 domain-containing protein [Thauera sp.]|jgi:hypothetical protein|nr:DUF1289 domain-containing protein [Thauera sp.]
MSGDALCVGVCMMDWEQGICLGCGRTQDEIDGVSTESTESMTDTQAAHSDATPQAFDPAGQERDAQ